MFRKLIRNRRGQSLVEYGILVGAVALVCLVGAAMLGHKVAYLYAASSTLLPSIEDDNAPVFAGKLVNTVIAADGSKRLSNIPGSFSNNLGISGAEGTLVTE